MATTYKIQYAGSVTPIEEPTLNDGSDTARAIHSDIDKVIGGLQEVSAGTTSTNVRYKDYTTTTSGVALNDATIFNATITGIDFLAVVIYDAGSTGTPDVQITLDGTNYRINFSSVNNFCIIPTNGLAGANIKIKSSGATLVAKVHIIIGVF